MTWCHLSIPDLSIAQIWVRRGLTVEGWLLLRAESSPSVTKRNHNSPGRNGGRGKSRSQLALRTGAKEGREVGAEEGRVESDRGLERCWDQA